MPSRFGAMIQTYHLPFPVPDIFTNHGAAFVIPNANNALYVTTEQVALNPADKRKK